MTHVTVLAKMHFFQRWMDVTHLRFFLNEQLTIAQ